MPPSNFDLFAVRLRTERLELRVPCVTDAPVLADFATRNRAHYRRWEPRRPDAYFTDGWWEEHLRDLEPEVRAGRSAPFLGFAREGELVLRVNLSNVVRGAFQAAHLGFAVDHVHEGKGLAREGVEAVIRFAFERWNLHRVMANHRPENERSAALLARLGFRHEGIAPAYLHIDGAWRDHVLTALVNDDWT